MIGFQTRKQRETLEATQTAEEIQRQKETLAILETIRNLNSEILQLGLTHFRKHQANLLLDQLARVNPRAARKGFMYEVGRLKAYVYSTKASHGYEFWQPKTAQECDAFTDFVCILRELKEARKDTKRYSRLGDNMEPKPNWDSHTDGTAWVEANHKVEKLTATLKQFHKLLMANSDYLAAVKDSLISLDYNLKKTFKSIDFSFEGFLSLWEKHPTMIPDWLGVELIKACQMQEEDSVSLSNEAHSRIDEVLSQVGQALQDAKVFLRNRLGVLFLSPVPG